MNPAIPSHTPRVRTLNYDALRNTLGCQSISGTAHLATLPFERVCVEDAIFDSIEDGFTKPRTVARTLGPAVLGVPQDAKYSDTWMAWVATKGVRIAKVDSVTLPANNIGHASNLFPTTKPEHLTIAFNSDALMAIAVQVGETITLKKFIIPTSDATETFSWPGVSPQLFSNWMLYFNEEPGGDDLVCYYISSVRRNVLCARFSSEAFDTEHIIHPDLPVDIDYIVDTFVQDRFTQVMTARLTSGDSATFTSAEYPIFANDKANLTAELMGGMYADNSVNTPAMSEDGYTLSGAIVGGSVADVMKVGSTISTEEVNVTAAIIAGFYE